MRKILFLSLVAIAFMMTSCEKETNVSANLTWEDVDYFELTDNWKACIYEGAINFIDAEDYDLVALETKDVNVDDETVIFSVSVSSYENFTVVVYNDENSNSTYDEAEVASVEFGGVDAGETAAFDLTISY